MPKKEKFPNEEVEKLKSLARLEDTLPEADQCPACAEARRTTGDPTYLCEAHLRKIYGL
jgi:hypothetical protein